MVLWDNRRFFSFLFFSFPSPLAFTFLLVVIEVGSKFISMSW